MSPANVKYIVERFQELKHKVEENPNSIDLSRVVTLRMDPKAVLERWGIPTNSVIFLYGGNLGIAQGTTFLLSLLSESKVFENVYFLIVGDGADYSVLKDWFDKNQPTNAKLIRTLPKTAFDELAACCDVGLILLRKEFTIPNFPSRLLTYMENKMPVLAITDKVSDIGSIAENAGFGIWCCYGDKEAALSHISFLNNNPEIRSEMGKIGFDYMKGQYDVKHSYNKIIDPINKAN
jgi:glycosyltransferase involved in cell wall biosynthesis